MRDDVAMVFIQDPDILREEIQVRRDLLNQLVGTLYPAILEGQIAELDRRLREILAAQKAGQS